MVQEILFMSYDVENDALTVQQLEHALHAELINATVLDLAVQNYE